VFVEERGQIRPARADERELALVSAGDGSPSLSTEVEVTIR
jgi:hypothetical protein